MIKQLVVVSLLATTATAAADNKPAVTFSDVMFLPRKVDDQKRSSYVIDIWMTAKLVRKVDDPKLAYLHLFAVCYFQSAANGGYVPPETQTPLTEMKIGKTQDLKFVAFSTSGIEQIPDKCVIEIRQGETKGFDRGTTISSVCWSKATGTVKSC